MSKLERRTFSTKWSTTFFSYREHALRRTKDAFREFQAVQNTEKLNELYQQGLHDLGVLRRQTAIGTMFKSDRLVVEVR
jgi:hypothetical protein